ncbi:uncharacterized protein TNIN_440191 [Trichonephila inaurata madagascariensis]|uniref:STING ligand-binding domain-containing protein n=1 Tax=Trichonephila inaurata madagascariensis TaxID=2747483 RepID=A0A8X6IAB2_9ARAC|nr:uncharacterized protein TNIN_440191 [Trichonephila inaurata madagascariensis]
MSTGIRKMDSTKKYRIIFFSGSLLFLCILCLLRFKLHGNLTSELILYDVALIFFILAIIVLTVIIRLVFVFGMEYHFSFEKNNSFLQQLQEHVTHEIPLCLLCVVGLCMFGFVNLWFETHSFTPQRVFEIIIIYAVKGTFIISISSFLASLDLLCGYDDYDLACSQKMEKSIGAFWAYGAYTSFYEKILFDIIQRMTEFEKENDVKFLVKKLVLICPLSNNTTGSIDNKDCEIFKKGSLRPVIDDQGANLDRKLKTTVYCIGDDQSGLCIAAEMPSPLATLWEARKMMDAAVLKYHRDCFIHTLKNLLESYPCVILEYDDIKQTPSESLHDFLLSSLNLQDKISAKEV